MEEDLLDTRGDVSLSNHYLGSYLRACYMEKNYLPDTRGDFPLSL